MANHNYLWLIGYIVFVAFLLKYKIYNRFVLWGLLLSSLTVVQLIYNKFILCGFLLSLTVIQFILYRKHLNRLRKNSLEFLCSSIPFVNKKWVFDSTTGKLNQNGIATYGEFAMALNKLSKNMIYATLYRFEKFSNIILLETITPNGEKIYDLLYPNSNITIKDGTQIIKLLCINNNYVIKKIKYKNTLAHKESFSLILNEPVCQAIF